MASVPPRLPSLPFISFPSASFISLLLSRYASIHLLLLLSCSFLLLLFTSVPISLCFYRSLISISYSLSLSLCRCFSFSISLSQLLSSFLPVFSFSQFPIRFSPCFFSLFLALATPSSPILPFPVLIPSYFSSSSPIVSSPSLSISFVLRSSSPYLLRSFSLSPNLLTHLFHLPFSSVKQRRIKGTTKNGGRASGPGREGTLSASDNENWIGRGSFYKVGIMVGQGDEE